MSNIERQYDWNNHKEMSQTRLTDEFVKLSLADKLTVYRTLGGRRAIILRKGYDKWKQLEEKDAFVQGKRDALYPFLKDIDISDIKSDYEFRLTPYYKAVPKLDVFSCNYHLIV